MEVEEALDEFVSAACRYYEPDSGVGDSEAFILSRERVVAVVRAESAAEIKRLLDEQHRAAARLHYALDGECPAFPGTKEACDPEMCDCNARLQDASFAEVVEEAVKRIAALEAENAELREDKARLGRLVADDRYASTFQTMGQYRSALLAEFARVRPNTQEPDTLHPSHGILHVLESLLDGSYEGLRKDDPEAMNEAILEGVAWCREQIAALDAARQEGE